MAELVVGPLISMVKDKLSSYLLDQYKVMEGMEEQRKILERKLPAILDIIEDAEAKGVYRPGVRAWLKELKTVAYRANDVFDEFKYEALRRDAMKKGQNSKLGKNVASFFSTDNPIAFRHRMGKKLQSIVQAIEVLVVEMNAFGFTHLQQAPLSNQWRQTDSIMVDSEKDIVSRSRDEERKEIVKILLDHDGNEDVMVLPIVGMGGLGKTTFVQLIYNDPDIEKHFGLRRWCCVSDDFDVGVIASNICESPGKDREKALQELKKEVNGKKYLIVLDDVWNRDADKWGKLKTCLKQGGKGSVVVITTRDEEVARVMTMGATRTYKLGKLGDKYQKEIIESKAFIFQKPDSNELDDIMHKIVERCDGSPLAGKAFGSMLSTKTTMQEWKDMLAKSNIFTERSRISPILKLSFDDLPSHMKKCFAFCAMFPKDYEIDVEDLIRLWIAHDLVVVPQEEDNLETVGAQIFKELTWRSFFQDVKHTYPIKTFRYKTRLRHITTCKIHDLMHDIATSVMGKDCVSVPGRPSDMEFPPRTVRHVFMSCYEALLDDFLKRQSRTLQTLFCGGCFSSSVLPLCSSLRAIHIPRYWGDQIRLKHLQHLRYLNLSHSNLKELPEGISMLYNLQTLDLSGCSNLSQLPKDMKYMASLRHLYTNGCTSLKYMPSGLSQITSLQTLTYFVAGTISGCGTIRELQNLNLGGELKLSGLDNVSEAHAKATSLGNKEKLTHLSLRWNSEGNEEPVQHCHKKVLDALKPHGRLEMLRIVSYQSTTLPAWATDVSLMQNLTELYLVSFNHCMEFPKFYHLRALRILHLIRLVKLQSLCRDMVFGAFPELKELKLDGLKSLERWVATEGEEEVIFPVLEKVYIRNCLKLTSLPTSAPNMKEIKLEEDKTRISFSLIRSRYMSSLCKLMLQVSDTDAALQLDQICESSISELSIIGCSFFFPSSPWQPIVGIWKWFGQLQELSISHCDVLVYWPEDEFISLVSLKKLYISQCNKLTGRAQVTGAPTRPRDQVLPQLKEITIWDCAILTELFVLPPSLTSIDVQRCPNFQFIWGKEHTVPVSTQSEHGNDLASTSMPEQPPKTFCLPCLDNLVVGGSNKLAALPNLPPSLKILFIYSCPELHSVSGQLDALGILSIVRCGKLESLDCLGDLPVVQTLDLGECRCLKSLPGCHGTYSALRRVTVEYCPVINMKPLYERLQQGLVNPEHRDLSHAHSSDPWKGPKLRDPKSWKYLIPGCR
ncbi:hypothetical protein ACP4OV_024520 [Aristida adscensionis]